MLSFVTGSRAYGSPSAESDLDLVVPVNGHDLNLLREFYERQYGVVPAKLSHVPTPDHGVMVFPGHGTSPEFSIFATSDPSEFSVQLMATAELKARAPVPHDYARTHFAETRQSLPPSPELELLSPAFITGSWAYGMPHPKSDLDLVIQCEPDDLEILRRFESKRNGYQVSEFLDSYKTPTSGQFMFGKLNLIACCEQEDFLLWRDGTNSLVANQILFGRPVTREEAMAHFAEMREAKKAAETPPVEQGF